MASSIVLTDYITMSFGYVCYKNTS